MAPRRHLTRHDMKQDEFVSWVTRATVWLEENARAVVTGIVVVAAIGILVMAGMAWQRSRTEKAFEMLAGIQQVVHTPLAGEPGAASDAFLDERQRAERVVEDVDRMLESYSSGAASRWARYYRAEALLELGRNDEAVQDAEAVAGGAGRDSLLGGLAGVLAGRAEEARGNLQRAAELYAQVAETAGTAGSRFPPEIALLEQARCLNSMGEKEQAISTYQRIVDVYPNSPMAARASQRLEQLQGTADGA